LFSKKDPASNFESVFIRRYFYKFGQGIQYGKTWKMVKPPYARPFKDEMEE